MANAQKIDEIIDEKAFQEWVKFVESLSLGQTRMAEMVTEAGKLNTAIGSAGGLATFTKSADGAAVALEKLRQEQAKTVIANERAAQAELKTIEITARKVKRDEAAALAAEKKAAATIAASEKSQKAEAAALAASEKAARRQAQLDTLMVDSVEDKAKHQEQASMSTVRNLRDEEKAQQANAASAVSAGVRHREVAEGVKSNTVAVQASVDAYSQYRRSLEDTIRDTMALKLELAEAKTELKGSGEAFGVTGSRALELEKTIAELNSMITANNLSVKRMTKENLSAKGSIDELENQLNSLRTAYRQLSDEERKSSVEAQNLLAEITKLDEEFKKQKKSIGQAQDDVGNYAAIWDQVPGPINNVLNSLGAIDTQTKKVSFASISNGIKELTRQAWAFVKTPIGAAIAALTVIVTGAKAWFDYNKGLVEATRLTEQLTGATGDTAKQIRNAALSSAEVFDKDFNEILRTANTLSSEFGISMTAAVEQINLGFIKGADSSKQMLDNLREYAPQMRSAGLSVEELMAVMVRSEKEGIFSDKGVDAIKEGTLRIREMTATTQTALTGIGIDSEKMQKDLLSGQITMFEAIQQVSRAMGDFSEDSREVGQVLADVFAGPGEDAGIRYLKLLGDINLGQEANLEGLTDIEKAQLMQLKATEELNNEYAALFDSTGGGFELMMANIKVISTDLLVSLIKGIRGVYNWFVDLYNESVLFRGVIETIPLAFGLVWDAAKGLFNAIGIGVKGLGDTIKAILTGDFDSIGSSWKNMLKEMDANDAEFAANVAARGKKAYRNTLVGQADRLEDFSLSGDGGTGTGASGTGGGRGSTGTGAKTSDNAQQRAIAKAIKARQDLDNRLTALAKERLLEEKRIIDETTAYSDKVVKDELNNYHDRLDNLADFYSSSQAAISKQKEIELTELQTLSNEATKLRAQGKTEEYDALMALIAIKEREVQANAVNSAKELDEEVRATTLALMKDRYAKELDLSIDALEQRISDEQLILARQFQQGLINEREYQEAKLEMQKETSVAFMENEIEQLEQLIALGKMKGVDTRELERNLAVLQLELSKTVADQQIEDIERVLEKEKEAAKIRQDLYKEIGAAAFELFDTLIERQIGDIDKEIELSNENKERELADVETSNQTKEQKAFATYAINEKYAQKEEDLRRKKIDAERKQAIFSKTQAVMAIGLNTAMGISRAFADWPFPVSAGIATAVGALGAIQLATALAQPLPQYWTGTDSSAGGPAHVGERGAELFVTPDGKLGMTPAKDTIMNLEEGTKIYNANETRRIMAGNASDSSGAEVAAAIREGALSSRELLKAFRSFDVQSTVITKQGWRAQTLKNNKFKKYLRQNGIN